MKYYTIKGKKYPYLDPYGQVKVSPNLKFVLWLLAILFIGLLIRNETDTDKMAEKSASSLLVLLAISYAAKKCSLWAFRIRKNQNTAYLIGFLFGIIFYWIYYRYQLAYLNKYKQ